MFIMSLNFLMTVTGIFLLTFIDYFLMQLFYSRKHLFSQHQSSSASAASGIIQCGSPRLGSTPRDFDLIAAV